MKIYINLLFLTHATVVVCRYAHHIRVYVDPSHFQAYYPTWLNVTIYYNSNCNASKEFFIKQLFPKWKKFMKYIFLELIPFGNSTLIESPIDHVSNWYKFEFISPFGPGDCLDNKLHACILNHPKDLLQIATPHSELRRKITDTHLTLLTCLMSHDNQQDALRKCAYEYNQHEIDQLKECVRTSEGSYHLAEFGRRTVDFFPPIRMFPFVSLNNSNRIQFARKAMTNLEYVICAHLPQLCRRLMTTISTTTPWPLTGH